MPTYLRVKRRPGASTSFSIMSSYAGLLGLLYRIKDTTLSPA